jgi:hypothetical protein
MVVPPQHRSTTWFVLKSVLSARPSSYWKSFINIPICLTDTSTNARSATKMMSQPTGIRILRKSGLMTERGVNSQNASRRIRKLHGHGELKTKEELQRTMPYLEPSVMAVYFGYPALGVGNKSPSLITRIMTNLSKLCGFVSRAINNGIKR